MRAEKLLQRIEESLVVDQGAKYRGLLKKASLELTDAFDVKEQHFRGHLGASLLGRECDRALWYTFHWWTKNRFDGRMIMLFNRGHLEEARFVAMLQTAGVQVWQHDANGKQIRVQGHRGHGGGSTDGVVRGVPDFPDIPMVAEFKTHSEKSFNKLRDEGMQHAKWEHFVQTQIYAGRIRLTKILYLAVNKNNDEPYAEIIDFDPVIFARYEEREKRIIDTEEIPPRFRDNPKWTPCRFCDHVGKCFNNEPPERNCRTCACVAFLDDGKVGCKRDLLFGPIAPRSLEEQMAGCQNGYVMKQ